MKTIPNEHGILQGILSVRKFFTVWGWVRGEQTGKREKWRDAAVRNHSTDPPGRVARRPASVRALPRANPISRKPMPNCRAHPDLMDQGALRNADAAKPPEFLRSLRERFRDSHGPARSVNRLPPLDENSRQPFPNLLARSKACRN